MDNKPYETGSWYPYLKNFTFESVFVPLTAEEGLAIQYHFEKEYKHEYGKFTKEQEETLKQLENKLDKEITKYKKENNCNST